MEDNKKHHLKKLILVACASCIVSAITSFASYFRQKTEPRNPKKKRQTRRFLQDSTEFKEYVVTWDIDLDGKDFLLESDFLKAGLEHSVKKLLNIELECEEDRFEGLASTGFYGVRINDDSENKMKISGNGRCKGNRTRCKKKVKQVNSDAGKADSRNFTTNTINDICDDSIFDLFKNTLITAFSFNYNVTIELINDFLGNLDLDLNVSFEEAKGNGLNQIDSISFDAEEPLEFFSSCDDRCLVQRREQRSIIQNALDYFQIEWDESRHECLFEAFNCNDLDLVTHIWLDNKGMYNLNGKTIPETLFQLPFLEGLFLGGNQLVGSIPSDIGKTNSDLKLLWLQDNQLSGQIPTRLGNLPIRELNLFSNKLTGPIPSELGKMSKLRLMNLGKNDLVGTIPNELFGSISSETPDDFLCRLFPKVAKSLGFGWSSRVLSTSTESSLESLEIFTLHGNRLSGSLPIALSKLSQLVELSFGSNNFFGNLPSELGSISQLQILDFHENNLSGLIPEEIGNLRFLKVLNLYKNRLEKTVPVSIGKLTQLKDLILGYNKLTGPIPSELGTLLKLDHLSFAGNKMSGIIPTEIGNLVSLKNLDIRDYVVVENQGNNKVAGGTLPSELGKLRSWKYVVFRNNGLQGTVPSEFGRLLSADAFWLKNEDVSGTIPDDFGYLKTLSVLYIRNTSLVGTIPTSIGILDNLETFDVGRNALTGAIPEEIASNTRLKHINIANNEMIGDIPTSLGNLTLLKYLNLENNNVNGPIPSEFGKLKSLLTMDLSGNDLTSSIPSELGQIDSLVSVDLSNNIITGTVPNELSALTSLIYLNITSNEVTAKRFMCALQSLELQESIDLNCSNYCNTVDEECNSTTIGSAKCGDIGCNGSGTPQCTNYCRLDYSQCNAGENEIVFELGLSTVSDGWQTEWEIRNDSGIVWRNEEKYRNHDSFIAEIRCLQRDCYTFELFDRGNDGTCCGEDDAVFGNYLLSVNGNIIEDRALNFESSVIHEVGSCSPSSEPTFNPTVFTTSSPSRLPSMNPTSSLSPSLSKHPSEVPTFLPSAMPTRDEDPNYDASSWNSQCRELRFRIADNSWNGKYSIAAEIGVTGSWNDVHAELTSRSLNDGETFIIEGSKLQVGVGLCIDSCDLESKVGIRFNYNCVGFYGDTALFYAADENNTEYTTVVDKMSSRIQGFTYDQSNNCVTHIHNATCIPLPAHFEGKTVRAIGQVWNSAIANIPSERRRLSFSPRRSLPKAITPSYDSSSWNSQCGLVTFRFADNTWNGKLSEINKIGVSGEPKDKIHAELTSRTLDDGEVFMLIGNTINVGAGLCIDSCDLESNFQIRGRYDCVGFFGNETVLWATNASGFEYNIPAGNSPSNTQGFTYNQAENCVTHFTSNISDCTPLPSHFEGKAVRAIGQVWNYTEAELSLIIIQ